MESIKEAFGDSVIPVQIPIGQEASFNGVVNVLKEKAYKFAADGSKEVEEIDGVEAIAAGAPGKFAIARSVADVREHFENLRTVSLQPELNSRAAASPTAHRTRHRQLHTGLRG